MTSTILVSFVPTCVLFDSNAPHYFALSALIIQHTVQYVTLDSGMNISTRNGIILHRKYVDII